MKNSKLLSLAAVFAALHVVLYFLSFDLWRNWAIYIAPLEGIILGPQVGFVAALLGSSIGRLIRPDASWMFGIVAEPLSVLMIGLLARARWKLVFLIYSALLAAYFSHPFGQILPLWTILDILVGLVLIYPAAKLAKYVSTVGSKRVFLSVAVLAFVCSASDSLIRVFLLVPAGLYALFFNGYESLLIVFVGSALSSYVEDLLMVIVALVISVPILLRSSKLRPSIDIPRKERLSNNGNESLGNS